MFYLVHKDDAKVHEECTNKRQEIRRKVIELFNKEGSPAYCECQPYEHSRDPYVHQEKKFEDDYKKIAEVEGGLRVVGPFDSKPRDMNNYLVCYRGRVWGKVEKSDALKMQDKGISSIKKLLGKE